MEGRVLVLDPFWDLRWARESLRGLDVAVEESDAPAGDDVIGLLVTDATRIGAAELAQLPRLRAVATASTGHDHLDVAALAAAGVWASNVTGYCDDEVAEHALAFAVDLLRGVTLLDRDVRRGGWDVMHNPPRRIEGARLGIAGFGRIGRVVARRARGLGMQVAAYDPVVPHLAIQAEDVEPARDLEELLSRADVVSLHVPLSDRTRGMIGADQLAAMQPGSFLVNCARSGLIDHAALAVALQSGHLGGAALDVLPTEPPAADEPVLAWPNTIINPHAAWYSPDSHMRPYLRAGADLAAALRGEEPAFALERPRRVRR